MTKEEWKNLKSGDVVLLKDYCNYWIVKSIGYEDLPEDEYTDNDYIVEIAEYDNGNIGGTIVNHYQIEKVITDEHLLAALKQGVEHSDDYLSFVNGVEWDEENPSDKLVKKIIYLMDKRGLTLEYYSVDEMFEEIKEHWID